MRFLAPYRIRTRGGGVEDFPVKAKKKVVYLVVIIIIVVPHSCTRVSWHIILRNCLLHNARSLCKLRTHHRNETGHARKDKSSFSLLLIKHGEIVS